uniref:Uncharacterized protein n=1 Tax=Cannabis sativa TaxID=3483 RepID=A0A803QRZ0_CANSA
HRHRFSVPQYSNPRSQDLDHYYCPRLLVLPKVPFLEVGLDQDWCFVPTALWSLMGSMFMLEFSSALGPESSLGQILSWASHCP